MTIALLTHPRSGSTKLIKCLYNSLQTEQKIKNLGEFFQITNSKNFGDLYPNTGLKFIHTKSLDISNTNEYLKDLILPGNTNFNFYIKKEITNRVLFMQKLNDVKIEHIFKYFFFNKPNENIYENLYSFLKNDSVEKIILYRKNLLESIQSHLIKEYIINQRYSKEDYDNFRMAGHNYGNMTPLLSEKKVYISFEKFKIDTEIFFNFYSYVSKNPNIEMLEYEKLFSQNFHCLKIGNRFIKVDLTTDPEIPMNYGMSKSKFFLNNDDFPEFIEKILQEKKLVEISKILDLTID
jgi:hypothetical protein